MTSHRRGKSLQRWLPQIESAGPAYPMLSYYSYLDGSAAPLASSGVIQPTKIAQQAQWDYVVIDATALIHRPDIAGALRQQNPNIKLYAYVQVGYAWHNPAPYYGPANDLPLAIWNMRAGISDGITPGDKGTDININMASTGIQEQFPVLLSSMVMQSGLFDGIFCDSFFCKMYSSDSAWNTQWYNGCIAFGTKLRQLAPPGYWIGGNAGSPEDWLFPLFNGWMRESIFTQNGRDGVDVGSVGLWNANMIHNGFGQHGLLEERFQQPALTLMCSASAGGQYGDPRSSTNLAKLRLGMGSAALGYAGHSFEQGVDIGWSAAHMTWWYPDYYTYDQDPIEKGWLGQPTSDAYKLANGVWERDFTKGIVLVNPDDVPCDVFGLPMCRPVGGTAATTQTVPPRDALLMRIV